MAIREELLQAMRVIRENCNKYGCCSDCDINNECQHQAPHMWRLEDGEPDE